MKKLAFIFTAIIVSLLILIYFIKNPKFYKNQSDEITKEFASKPAFKKDNLSDLPLLRFESAGKKQDYFVILFPGDGGWRDFINYLSNYMAGNNINVVGFNTVPYFNSVRTPGQIAKDVQRVMRNFGEAWDSEQVILAGYSFGAEILPFVYNHLDSLYKSRVACLTLIAPSSLADFKVSPVYYYNPSNSLPVGPELDKINTVKVLIFCDKQKKSLCKVLDERTNFDIVKLDMGHLFTGKFKEGSSIITNRLIRELETDHQPHKEKAK